MNQTVNNTGNLVSRMLPTHELNARRQRKRALAHGKARSSPDADLETTTVFKTRLNPCKSNL